MWKGTAETLKAKPMRTNTMPSVTSGVEVASSPIRGAMSTSSVVPLKP